LPVSREIFYQTPNQAESQSQNIAYQGRPDGAAVDSAGNYWNAQFEGGQVIQFSPSGEILQRVMLPAKCPTMVSFGGDDLKTLLVTTTGNRPAEELADYPANGFILTMAVEVAGLPTRRYKV
jgi:sugar lactone lactonase YvrE